MDSQDAAFGTAVALIGGAGGAAAMAIGLVYSEVKGWIFGKPDKTKKALEQDAEVRAVVRDIVETQLRVEREKAERKLQREANASGNQGTVQEDFSE